MTRSATILACECGHLLVYLTTELVTHRAQGGGAVFFSCCKCLTLKKLAQTYWGCQSDTHGHEVHKIDYEKGEKI